VTEEPRAPASAGPGLGKQLRDRLLSPDELAGMDVHGRIDAAVLIPIFVRDGELHAVFTKRREDMKRHAGEVSFPGGRQDVDEEDLRVTALREAEEEIGLPRDAVEIVGAIGPTATFVTNYAVYPFVGLIEDGREWTISEREVDHVLEFSLRRLREVGELRRLVRKGIPFQTHVYEIGETFIWGATARMLNELLERLDPLLGGAAA
jgi:8-oxo-dGTP pyrophosphatase MutT (NUDIX family)